MPVLVVLLALLLQVATPTPTPVPPQVMDTYVFWLAVIDRLTPLVDAFFKLMTPIAVGVGAWILYKTRHDVGETRRELGEVHGKVDGQGEELRSLTGRAAHAEGKLEGITEASVAPVPPVQVVVDPDALPGGRRRLDPPATSPPVDVDPTSHMP